MNVKRYLTMEKALFILVRCLCSSLLAGNNDLKEVLTSYIVSNDLPLKVYSFLYNELKDVRQSLGSESYDPLLYITMFCGSVLEAPKDVIDKNSGSYQDSNIMNLIRYVSEQPHMSLELATALSSITTTIINKAIELCNHSSK